MDNPLDLQAAASAAHVAHRIIAFVERYVRDEQQQEAAQVLHGIAGESFKAGANGGVGAVKEVMEKFGVTP